VRPMIRRIMVSGDIRLLIPFPVKHKDTKGTKAQRNAASNER
jgi:hypothetical protein